MKRSCKIMSVFLALLLLLSTLSGCTGYIDPLGYLKDAAIETLKSTLVGEMLALMLDVSNEGMISIEFGGTDLVQNLPDAADLTLWINAQDWEVAADGEITLAGERYDLSAYLNENEMAVISSAFLGSNTLGVNFLTMEKDLKTSIFSNSSGTVFSDPAISSASAARVQVVKKSFFKMLANSERTLDFIDEVADIFLDQLTEYAENSRYTEEGNTHISLTINNDSLARTLRAARAALVEDGSCRDYLIEVSTMLDSAISATTGVTSTEYSTKVQYFLSSEADIDTLCQRIDDAQPFTLKLSAVVESFGMALTDVSLSFARGGETRLEAALHLDEELLSLSVTLDGVARQLTYRVSKDGWSEYRAALNYQKRTPDGAVTEINGELQADKGDGTYTLTLTKGDEVRVFGGKYAFDTDEMMIAVETASVNGESKRLSLKISLVADEGVPEMPDYVNVVAMDVTRFTPIYDRATKTREQLLQAWQENGLSAKGALSDLLNAIGLPEEIP